MTTGTNQQTTVSEQIKVIFLHHSTGANLIQDGKVRAVFHQHAPFIAFWDHGYDPQPGKRPLFSRLHSHLYGLRDATGRLTPDSFHIPNNNTNPDGLATLFSQPVSDPPTNAFSHLLLFDVIIFKSCFPVTAIVDDEHLRTYQDQYLTLRDVMDTYPHKIFIPMTPPPLRANLTTREQATRASSFAYWIMSEQYHQHRPHIKPYDFFHLLATPDTHPQPYTLRPAFCHPDLSDSHPNRYANTTTAPHWTSFIITTITHSSLATHLAHRS